MSGELHEEKHIDGGNERWLVSYADMVTLLMVVFVVMFAMSQLDLERFAALATSVRAEMGSVAISGGKDMGQALQAGAGGLGIVDGTGTGLRNNIEKMLDRALGKTGLQGNVEVLQVDGNLIIRLLDKDILFESGDAALTARNRELLSRVAAVLRMLPYQIRIEGHTDSMPINTALFPSNWELSTRRATNVVLHLVRAEEMSPDRISATGYADTRPIASNDTPQGRQKNRRIDIVLATGQDSPSAAVLDVDATGHAVVVGTEVSPQGSPNIVPPISITSGP
jgi:chemotaxis protein MotB